MKLVQTPCPLCQNISPDSYSLLYESNLTNEAFSSKVFSARRLPDKLHYRLVRCKHDGLIRSNPIADGEILEDLYAKSEFTYSTEVELLTTSYFSSLKRVLDTLPSDASLLEIGCGNGFLLEKIYDYGFHTVYGVEPSKDAIQNAPRHIRKNITRSLFKKELYPDSKFDVVFFFQTLDHIPNPTQFLSDCYDVLKPGGVVVSLHHNVEYWLVQLLKDRHPIIDVEHTHLYSPKTTQAVFESQGFLTDQLFSPKQKISVRHLIHLSPLPALAKKALLYFQNVHFFEPFFKRSFWVELGNTVYIGRKPSLVFESNEVEKKPQQLTFSKNQKKLRTRIIELSFQKKLSHLGSCVTVVDILDALYSVKKKRDEVVLSSGHAALALYVVLEKYGLLASEIIPTLYIHPDRSVENNISVSTGSLGQGLPIAVGMALASPEKHFYCVVSDGECSEGSIWESISLIVSLKIRNLTVIVNANGYGAYREVETSQLKAQFEGFGCVVTEVDGHDSSALKTVLKASRAVVASVLIAHTAVDQLPFLSGVDAHYHVLSKTDFAVAKELWQT